MGTTWYVVADEGVPREAFELGKGSWCTWGKVCEISEADLAVHLKKTWDGDDVSGEHTSAYWAQVAADLYAFCVKHEWKVTLIREPDRDEIGPIDVVGSRYTEERKVCLAGGLVCPWLMYGYEVTTGVNGEKPPQCRMCGTPYEGQSRLKTKVCSCDPASMFKKRPA